MKLMMLGGFILCFFLIYHGVWTIIKLCFAKTTPPTDPEVGVSTAIFEPNSNFTRLPEGNLDGKSPIADKMNEYYSIMH